ncbi:MULTISPECIES: hypothetical protein [Planococcus]|uniref:Uncharacterized protein n=1 Tax=Planococcus faecalis TaxID=1598147 RepID=A0ABM6IVY2_9BACL|nr:MULTISPECIES: hypothetical protein [Planococcus]AQU80733.1 hypothetical protein AJGP001_16195 [Planococcus faecalis]MDJ0331949.1 hypothetical protein [Planococcus sp. S3-L1]OHX55724.1 hypothetical protein BB777_00770 [Planococcus faecalis]
MLWILSQNKQSLMNVKDVSVKGKYIQGFVENSFLDQWNKTIGKYESNERAIEILSELFAKIEESPDAAVTFTMPQK